MRRTRPVRFSILLAIAALLAVSVGAPAAAAPPGKGGNTPGKAVFFAADGMRQDIVEKYAAAGVMPTMKAFLKGGTKASGNGLLTQAPPNTGAGWYTLATGAWPGVHASTNNTFHKNGDAFGTARTAAFDPGVLQAESIAQSAERGGLKVAQVEWAGGRNATIQGPTIDFRGFLSGRGVATNFIGQTGDALFDDAPFISAFGLQFDHPAGYPAAGRDPVAAAAVVAASGWTGVPASAAGSPAKEMRLRVLDGPNPNTAPDKYGLNAYIFDSTADATVNYDRVLFSRTKSGAAPDAVGTLAKGEWADVKVTINGGALNGQTAGMLIKVEELNADLSRVRLFHTSVTRANATWPTWGGEPGFSGSFEEYVARTFPTSTAADFAILEAGVTSEDTYVEQGLYWATGHVPMLEYVADRVQARPPPRRDADDRRVPAPVPRARQPEAAGRRRQPGVRRRLPRRHEGQPRRAARGVHPDRVPGGRRDPHPRPVARRQEPDDVRLVGPRLRAAVPGDRREQAPRRPRPPARRAAGLELPDRAAHAATHRHAHHRELREGEGVLGGWGAAGLPQRRGSGSGSPAVQRAEPVPRRRHDAQPELHDRSARAGRPGRDGRRPDRGRVPRPEDPTDWNHDGSPDDLKMIDRVFTKAEARYIPIGGGQTADMAHPTRTGDLIVFSYPPYQYDAETPGTIVAPSHFFGQHGYVPDVQDLAANINMRATFLAGGTGVAKGQVVARSIDLAPTLAFILGIPAAAAQPGQGPARRRQGRQRRTSRSRSSG